MVRRLLLPLLVLLVVLPAPSARAGEWRQIHFPVAGPVTYTDDFGDPRSGGRTHTGIDIMGAKLQHLIAAAGGRVSYIRTDSSGTSGNMLTIRDSAGWQYTYVHVNNDSPGTDDNANPAQWIFTPGISLGATVTAGQHIGYLGDSGNAESSSPHLHFEIRRPDGTYLNPYSSLRLAQGYPVDGRCRYDTNPPSSPSSASGAGYWIASNDGGVFTFGALRFHGSMGGTRLAKPVVGMEATPSNNGYWLVASDGGIFTFGDAGFFGSTGAMTLNKPVVGMATTPSGRGYWLVASDGGIFTFGDAGFFGSTGAMALAKPVVGMAATPTGNGYWLVASDGGIFTFGSAGYYGSMPGFGWCSMPPAIMMRPSSTGAGYWILTNDGAIFTFGDAMYHGGVNALGLSSYAPPVAMAL